MLGRCGKNSWLFALTCVAIAGCNDRRDLPDLGLVSGIVTFNGKPLPLAKVVFRPTGPDGGRMATAVTDASGEYKLVYLEYPRRIYGTKPGPQSVIISTLLHKADPGGPKPETLPSAYTVRDSVLKADVKPGAKQRIDWQLDSQGGH